MAEFENQIEGEIMLENVASVVEQTWNELSKKPDQLTDLSKYEQKVVFVAGGGLVGRFGEEESIIWKAIKSKAENDQIEIAGVKFGVSELKNMGDFYRFMKTNGYNFHCIDERLEGDEVNLDKEVHCKCGACAAVGKAANLENVEDVLLTEVEQKFKQDVYEDMPNHDAMVVLVDLRGSDVVLGEKREELKAKHALPFNVSLPLDLVSRFVEENNVDSKQLISTLVKWNVQIARNIIEDPHNELARFAERTLIVVDNRGVDKPEYSAVAMEEIQKVNHGKLLTTAA